MASYRFNKVDRVLETATSPGTGNVSLGGAVPGFRTFASLLGAGDTCAYTIENVDANGNPNGGWERGFGTFQSGPVLARTTIIESSAGGTTAVNFAGNVRVGITMMSDTVVCYPTPGGRLTGVSGGPVGDTPTTGNNAIYYVPYMHDRIPVWNGAGMQIMQIPAAGLTINVASMAAGTAWDVFAYPSGMNLALETAQWTSPTSRGSFSIVWSSNGGYIAKSTDATRRWIGSFYIDTAGTIYDVAATGSSNSQPAKRLLFNAYNRVAKAAYMQDSGANWSGGATGNWRVIRGQTIPAASIQLFQGLGDESVYVAGSLGVQCASGVWANGGIGLDGTSVPGNSGWGDFYTSFEATQGVITFSYSGQPGLGYHTLTLLEGAAAASPYPTFGWAFGGVGMWGVVRC
jgi:hypothetical protein